MKNRMLFDYINSLDSQTHELAKQWAQDRRKLVSLYLFMRVVVVLLGL